MKALCLFFVVISSLAFGRGVQELDDQNFARLTESGFAVVEFYAPWCGNCKRFAPIYNYVAKNGDSSIIFGKVNGDYNPKLMNKYGITGYPTLILFDNQAEKARLVGFHSRHEVEEFLNAIKY